MANYHIGVRGQTCRQRGWHTFRVMRLVKNDDVFIKVCRKCEMTIAFRVEATETDQKIKVLPANFSAHELKDEEIAKYHNPVDI